MNSFRKPGAQENMTDQREEGVSAYGSTALLAAELNESILDGPFDAFQRLGVSELSQCLFGDVADKVADVQSRITNAVQVKVKEPEPGSVSDKLRRVKIPVDSAWNRRRCN